MGNPVIGGERWHSSVEAPRVSRSAEMVDWHSEADVVVVGCGGAGISAAIQAREEGAEVIALDRFSGGGSTAVNGGIFYAGGGTAAQKEAGVEDSAEEMFRYLRMETAGVVSDELLRRYCEGSVGDADWMTRHGVRFSGKLYPHKTSYPHTSYYLYHSDSSLSAPYRDQARSSPRGHRAFMPGNKSAEGYGAGLYYPLERSAEELGVRLMRNAEVVRLVVDEAGAVIGVEAKWLPDDSPAKQEYDKLVRKSEFWTRLLPPAYPGATLTRLRGRRLMEQAAKVEQRHCRRIAIRARKGVVLSTGGFIYNRPMLADEAPAYLKGMPQGTAGDTGAGVRLGQSVGGTVSLMSHCSAWRFLNPPLAWAQGMLVNQRGERFANETHYGAIIGSTMVEEHGGKAWLIADLDLVRAARRQARAPDVLPFQRYPALLAMRLGRRKASTAQALADKMGFDREAFGKTLRDYNAAARGEAADPFGKAQDELRPMERGPFFAIDMSIDAKYAPLPVMTLGGLNVDEDSGLVRREDGTLIDGLYAAGRTAVGLCSNVYVSGLAVADCIFSGRRAGRHAARTEAGLPASARY